MVFKALVASLLMLLTTCSNAKTLRALSATNAPSKAPRCTPYFSLVDVLTQKSVDVLCTGDTIHMSTYSKGMTVVLNPSVTRTNFDRVAFFVNGVQVSDEYANYSLLGGLPYKAWSVTPGTEYTVKAVLFRGLEPVHQSYTLRVHVAK